MSKAKENVFIAWGGNQELANAVKNKLEQQDFNGIVGGSFHNGISIGKQILLQIDQCTSAIILLKKRNKNSNNDFSYNLMFEWGYITAKMDIRKLHIFLIGVTRKNLPSDLSGIWATEIVEKNKTTEQIARKIVNEFRIVAHKPIEINKMRIFNQWAKIKHDLSSVYSEIEIAHYLLHSIEICYYYMGMKELLAIIDKIDPSSDILKFVIKIVRANSRLFSESPGLLNPIPFDKIDELKQVFEKKFDFSRQDENLNLWLKYFCSNRLALLSMFTAQSDAKYKNKYLQKALEHNNTALRFLKEIAKKYPKEKTYTKLYEGYVYRDFFKTYKNLNNSKEASKSITNASKARYEFYSSYEQCYPNDIYLIKHFGGEYYLSCAERLKYIKIPRERQAIENKIRSFLSELEPHAIFIQLRSFFDKKGK